MKLPKKVELGITMPNYVGEVPEFEQREAAAFTHYNWTEWQQLDVDSKAGCVAHYRMHYLIESHARHVYDKHSESQQRRAQAKSTARSGRR